MRCSLGDRHLIEGDLPRYQLLTLRCHVGKISSYSNTAFKFTLFDLKSTWMGDCLGAPGAADMRSNTNATKKRVGSANLVPCTCGSKDYVLR